MKTLIVLSALLPAGLIAAFLGSPVTPQEDAARDDAKKKQERIEIRSKERRGPVIQELLSVSPKVRVGSMALASGGHADHASRKALNKLRKAESEDDKRAARAELSAALGEEFDRHLDQQARELKQLEERLDKLRGQWEKRRDAKDEIVALRLQSLENDVNGLGWPAGGPGFWHEAPPSLHLPMDGDHLMFQGTLAEPPMNAAPMIPPQPGYRFSIETDVEDEIEVVPEIDEDETDDEDSDESVRYEWSPPPQPGR